MQFGSGLDVSAKISKHSAFQVQMHAMIQEDAFIYW